MNTDQTLRREIEDSQTEDLSNRVVWTKVRLTNRQYWGMRQSRPRMRRR